MPPDVEVAGGQLVHAQRPGVAGADRRVVVQPDSCSGDCACPGPKCHHMFLEPRQASALVHHQVSRVLRLVLQCVHCHVWAVRHPCSNPSSTPITTEQDFNLSESYPAAPASTR